MRRKVTVSLIIFAMIVISVILSISVHSTLNKEDSTVFTINNEPVLKSEFITVMSSLKSNTYTYFLQKYGAQDGPELWNTNFDGEIPSQVLKQQTMIKLKRIKIEQLAMKKNGLVQDISYSAFLKDFNSKDVNRQ